MVSNGPRGSHSLVQSIQSIPVFSNLDDKTLFSLVGESMNLFWKAGSTIFERGSEGDALYVVLEGECSIREGDDNGVEVAHPKPGDSFGEMSLLLNTTHTRTAVSVTDCELLVLPKESFTALLESNPMLAEHFREVVRKRDPKHTGDKPDVLEEKQAASG